MDKVNENISKVKMPILSPRLKLRLMKPGDGAKVLQYKKDSWNELKEWSIWSQPPSIEMRAVEDDEEFCSIKYERFKNGTDISIIALDKETEQMIGAGGLHLCNWDLGIFTLGFTVNSKHTKNGYATEIATALTKYAFEALDANKVSVFHSDGNIGSQKVIEKTGFIKEGVLRKCSKLWEQDIVVDEHHYGLIKGEFKSALNISWG